MQAYNIHPLPGTEFVQNGKVHVLIGHDYRLEPSVEWLRNTRRRIMGSAPVPEPAPADTLDLAAFRSALSEFLDQCCRKRRRIDNPLLHVSLVRQPVGADADLSQRHEILRQLLIQASQGFMDAGPTQVLHRVLDRSYFNPAGKQQAVAAALQMSYATYRRRLAEAIASLGDRLWEMELSARSKRS